MLRSRTTALLLSALAGCAPSGTLVVAEEGGTVSSPDGAFTLVVPPGALDEDTRLSIEVLPEDRWPVDAPSRFERIGEVYAVEPAGLTLAGDAYLVQVLAAAPDVLRTAEGDDVMAVHYLVTGEGKVRPAPATRTVHLADGRAAVVATLYELGGAHWTGERVPGAERSLVRLAARIGADAGDHEAGAEWRWTEGGVRADEPLDLVGREVRAAVVGAAAPAVEPLSGSGWTRRTWDATSDPELGLHPWEVFGIEPADRRETVAILEDPMPVSVGPDRPLAPVSTPLPGWSCSGAGTGAGTLFAGVDVVSGASSGTVRVGVAREIGAARCR